jgi:hypothetical protein
MALLRVEPGNQTDSGRVEIPPPALTARFRAAVLS